MKPTAPSILLIADHPGPPHEVVARWLRYGRVEPLTLPWWEDSSLSRAFRLFSLPPPALTATAEHADRLLRLFHDALVEQGMNEDEGQYLRQVVEAHVVTPLVEAEALVRESALRTSASLLVAVVDVRSREWWSGKHMAESAARTVAAELGLPLRIARLAGPVDAAVRLAGRRVRDRLRDRAFARKSWSLLMDVSRATQRNPLPRPCHAQILLLSSGPVVQRLALRIADAVTKRGASCAVLRDPSAPSSSEAQPLPSLGSLATQDDYLAAAQLAAQGPANARRLMERLSPNLSPAEREVLGTRALALEACSRSLLRLFSADACRMMDEINPRVVVGFDALPRLRTSYLVAARRRGLPTVFCQHGLFSALDYPSPWFDEFLVVNEYTRELLSGQIPPTARITVVGDPSLDALVTQPPQALRAVPEHSGPVALIATQPNDPPGSERRPGWWFAALAQACAKLQLCAEVKLHPQQRPEVEGRMYERSLADAGASGLILPHGEADLNALLAGCDVFVSQFSSSILAAVALGKSTMFVDLRNGPPFYPFDDFDMALRATTPQAIEETLRAALERSLPGTDPVLHSRFYARHLAPLDGRATERLADALLAYLG